MTFVCFVLVTTLFGQTPTYTISTLSGTSPTGDNGRARDARLLRPEGMVADPQGNIFFCDRGNGRVRRIGRDQVITTVAGGGTLEARDGAVATSVRLFDPLGIALNRVANVLYFSDSTLNTVYALNLASGVLNVVAGNGRFGFAGDGGPATAASVAAPSGLAHDATLGLLIADSGNQRIRRVDLTTGNISTFAGNGNRGFGGDGGGAVLAQLRTPLGVAVAADRAVYIADYGNSRIRRVRSDGTMETVAGNGLTTFSGDNGPAVGAGIDAQAVTVAANGTLYLVDEVFHRIRRVTPEGVISTVAGTGVFGFSGDGGLGTAAQLDAPTAVAIDFSGDLLIADALNHRIRRMTVANGLIDTVAGRSRFGGDAVQASLALMTEPRDVSYDAAGNLYVADTGNHCIRRIGRDGVITVVAGVGGEAGRGAENVEATTSRLDAPSAVVVDTDGTLYIADRGNARIRSVNPAGMIRTIGGNFPYFAGALALQPQQRRLIFTDSVLLNGVLSLDLANPTATAVPVAGSGRGGFTGDGGPAVSAALRGPEGVAVAPNGDIYFVDVGNGRLRRVDAAGVISTVAGNGELEVTPTDGPLTSSILSAPSRVAIDGQGNIFLTERLSQLIIGSAPGGGRIRRISGTRIDTIAGQNSPGFAGDGGPARQALMEGPYGLAVAADGSVAFADSLNHRVRRLTPTTTAPPAVAASLVIRGGNNQSGTVGLLLPQALTVAAVSASSAPVAGQAIAFAVTSGTATLSAASVNTGTDGLASVTVTLGATAGPVQITARSGTLTPVVFSLTATAVTGPPPVTALRPVISRGGVIGVGVSVPAVTTISPRGIITIFGQNFLETGMTGRRVNFATEAPGGVLPTRLLGVCVEIGGTRAPMLDAFGTQLNVVVPAISGPTAAVRVIRRCDQPDAVTSEPETVPVAAVAPEFLYSQLNADGRNPVAAVNAVTGALIGPITLPGFTPAQSGDILTIFATGFGGTDPAIVPGGTSAGVASLTAAVRVRIGTITLSAADVLYVGASPGSLIYQVNLRVPVGLPDGNLPVQIFLNEIASPANAYLTILSGPSVAIIPGENAPGERAIRMRAEREGHAERGLGERRKPR